MNVEKNILSKFKKEFKNFYNIDYEIADNSFFSLSKKEWVYKWIKEEIISISKEYHAASDIEIEPDQEDEEQLSIFFEGQKQKYKIYCLYTSDIFVENSMLRNTINNDYENQNHEFDLDIIKNIPVSYDSTNKKYLVIKPIILIIIDFKKIYFTIINTNSYFSSEINSRIELLTQFSNSYHKDKNIKKHNDKSFFVYKFKGISFSESEKEDEKYNKYEFIKTIIKYFQLEHSNIDENNIFAILRNISNIIDIFGTEVLEYLKSGNDTGPYYDLVLLCLYWRISTQNEIFMQISDNNKGLLGAKISVSKFYKWNELDDWVYFYLLTIEKYNLDNRNTFQQKNVWQNPEDQINNFINWLLKTKKNKTLSLATANNYVRKLLSKTVKEKIVNIFAKEYNDKKNKILEKYMWDEKNADKLLLENIYKIINNSDPDYINNSKLDMWIFKLRLEEIEELIHFVKWIKKNFKFDDKLEEYYDKFVTKDHDVFSIALKQYSNYIKENFIDNKIKID